MDEISARPDPRSPRTIVSVSGLSKTYGRVVALDGVVFSIRRGEILGLIGPNGAGKTTLFECLAGVQPADRGEVTFADGYEAARRGNVLFYLPDGIAPWPGQTVEWALGFSLDFFGGHREFYNDISGRLDIAPIQRTRMKDLSQGQRKRALLAMALLTPQPVLLVDEPFEGLDIRQSREAAKTLRSCASLGRTLFLSIHQIVEAGRFCDRFVLLSGGRTCGEGTADELATLAAGRTGRPAPADFEEVFLALT
jgi:ABC-2 type transport system ATP-binding protein